MRGIFYKFPAKSKQRHPAIATKRRPRWPSLAHSQPLLVVAAATFLSIAKITVQLTNEEPSTHATFTNALGQRPDRAPPGAVPAIPAASPNFEAAFQGECGQNNSQSGNPCEHICLDLHDGTYECSCFYGFTLAVDGYSCARLPPAASFIVSSPEPQPQPQPLPPPPAPPGQNARSTGPPVARAQLSELEQSQSLERPRLQQQQQPEPANGRANDKRKLHDESRGAGSGEDAQAAPPFKSSSNRLSATASPWSSWAVSGSGGDASDDHGASEPPTWAQPQKPAAAPTTTTTPTQAEATKMSRQHERELRNKVVARTTATTTTTAEAAAEAAAAAARWPVELESGGDKRMSYDVDVASSSLPLPPPPPPADEDDSRPPAGGMAPSGETRNSPLSLREDIDPDIRSIMMVNDRLVEQLAQSVSQLAGRRPAGFGAANADHDGGAHSRGRRAEDYDMKKLAQLVEKTMSGSSSDEGEGEENEYGEPDSDQDDNRAPTPLAAGRPTINEPAGAANQSYRWRPTDERASGGGRGDGTRQRRPHSSSSSRRLNSNNNRRRSGGPEQPSNGRNNCHRRLEKLYANCNDMPECESGGRCALEPISGGGDGEGGPASQDHHDNNDKPTTIGGGLTWAARCRCPIGRGGSLCQRPIQREVPRFLGHSYLALPMGRGAPALASLRLIFRPDSAESLNEPHHPSRAGRPRQRAQPPPQPPLGRVATGPERAGSMVLLLYSSKFALLLDNSMSRIELHYLSEQNDDGTSKITRVMGSRDVKANEWNELVVIDATTTTNPPAGSNGDGKREPSMVAGGGELAAAAAAARHSKVNISNSSSNDSGGNKIILVTPDRIGLAGPAINSSELFVAGLPALAAGQPAEDRLGIAQAARGFRGCIRELEINARRYNLRSDLNGDTLDGFDVVECCNLSSPASF